MEFSFALLPPYGGIGEGDDHEDADDDVVVVLPDEDEEESLPVHAPRWGVKDEKEDLEVAVIAIDEEDGEEAKRDVAESVAHTGADSAEYVPRSIQLTDATVRSALERFGHKSLRGHQVSALKSVCAGKDTIVLLPTGGGKSLCFQLPALLLGGLVVVISPLLALMQDQVQALKKRGIRVEMLCSLATPKGKRETHDKLLRDADWRGHTDQVEILYTTPETLRSESLQSALRALYRKNRLALFAVDEAHCISSWGHDFRPAYRRLGTIREAFPSIPIIALTATAPDRVREDIHSDLKLRPGDGTTVLMGDFNRSNISYTTHNRDTLPDPEGALLSFVQRCHRGSVGIVYVHRRLDTEALVRELQMRDPSIRAAPYHAELPKKQRATTLTHWLEGRLDIICATIAFGMGIDHPSVRFVVHWNMPKSMEGLYQESGRAGRDGHPSHHLLLYSHQEYLRFRDLLELAEQELREKEQQGLRLVLAKKKKVDMLKEKLKGLEMVMQWASGRSCRRKTLLDFFGQIISEEDCQHTCDVCNSSLSFHDLQPLVSHRQPDFTFTGSLDDDASSPRRQRKRSHPRTDTHGSPDVPRHQRSPRLSTPSEPRVPFSGASIPLFSSRTPSPAPPRRPPPAPAFTPPPRQHIHMPPPFAMPANVQSIRDYIKATESLREGRVQPWGGVDRCLDVDELSDSDSADDDVTWLKTEVTGAAVARPLAAAPPATRIKRQRRDVPGDVIVIDDSD